MKIDFNQWGAEEKQEIDFPRIKAIALNSMEVVLKHWLPGGKVAKGEYLCGSMAGGQGESCSTNLVKGCGSDFATGEKWGDAIELVAKIDGLSMPDAARKLEEFFNVGPGTPRPEPPAVTQSPSERYEAGKKAALALWVESETCPHHHPYLIKKQVPADQGIRLHTATGNILIPLYDEHGTLWSVQRIFPDGDKKINACGKMTGNFFLISGERDTVYICEGYSTAQTVAIATGKTVVMTVTAGNLAAVGEKISKMFPTAHLVFAADNDNVTPKVPNQMKNPGMTLAEKAVKEIGRGTVIAPPAAPETKVDWNDYALECGAQATRNLLVHVRPERMFIDAKMMELKEPEFLIEDVIETPCTGMIIGPSGSGKSFFVFDLAMHCATGRPWHGKKVKEGPVIYICGEGRHAIPRRIRAWEKHYGADVPYKRLITSTMSIDFEPENVQHMVQEIDAIATETGAPVMIIIDTMARALPGQADENSTKDTGGFIKECDRLQGKYDCAVVIVHHTGHSETKRARGSSALKGAMDVEILVSKEGTIEWTKTKDIEPHPPINFGIKKVFFGEGKHANSCVLEYDFACDPKQNKLTANMKAAVKSLYEAVQADGLGGGVCFLQTWRDGYKGYLEGVSDRAKQKSFREQVTALEERGMVVVAGMKVTAVKMRDEMVTDTMFGGLFK